MYIMATVGTSVDAAVAAFLSELGAIFSESRTKNGSAFLSRKEFFALLPIGFSKSFVKRCGAEQHI